MCLSIVNKGGSLGSAENIIEANKQADIYFGRPFTLCIFFFLMVAIYRELTMVYHFKAALYHQFLKHCVTAGFPVQRYLVSSMHRGVP